MDNYDIVPSGLIQLIKKRLNYGLDQAGRKKDQPTRFTVGCGLNLEPGNAAREMQLSQKKDAKWNRFCSDAARIQSDGR